MTWPLRKYGKAWCSATPPMPKSSRAACATVSGSGSGSDIVSLPWGSSVVGTLVLKSPLRSEARQKRQTDQLEMQQIGRLLGHARRQGTPDWQPALSSVGITDATRHHARVSQHGAANDDVKAIAHQVHLPIIRSQLNLDFWSALAQPCQLGQQVAAQNRRPAGAGKKQCRVP